MMKSLTPAGRQGLGLLLVGGMGLLAGFGLSASGWLRGGDSFYPEGRLFSQTALHAVASDSAEGFAVATGAVDGEMEGFYMLDALTGDLQCAVLNNRTAKFNALFKANVLEDFGIAQGKKPRFLLVTGQTRFAGGAGRSRPSESVAYVFEANSGKYAAYGLQWSRERQSSAQPQGGALHLIDVGVSRAAVLRD